MIVLDTNVISEMMRAEPTQAVAQWYKSIPRPSLLTTAITKAEILYGIETMDAGRKRSALAEAANRLFNVVMVDQILAFDARAAEHYADILTARRRIGKPVKTLDVQIAAISRSHGMAIATRNVDDFTNCGIEVINPWIGEV
jgi:predicted nucleic acid-binding protein